MAVLPPGQSVRHDERETVESAWLTPRRALARYWAGEIRFAPPQIMSLAHLARHPTSAAAIEHARGRPPGLIEPQSFQEEGARVLVYPGDPRHTVPTRVLPGPSRLYWRNERFEPQGGFEGYFAD